MSLLLVASLVLGQGIPAGDATLQVDLGPARIAVFTYKPPSYRDGGMLIVFHGMNRNAEDYRNDARSMGDRFGMLVVAPRFDEAQFGKGMYQQGGLKHNGKIAPRSKWTWSLVPKLAERLREREGRPDMPYFLIGHSAGGQFLVRLAAFVPTGASRIVAANPGSELFPTRELPYPYGFGGLPEPFGNDEQLRLYLSQPLTLYLGSKDTERDPDLDTDPDADRQGLSRWDRGRTAFRNAEQLARSKGWAFRWRLVEAPGIGHDHTAMFDAPACRAALFAPN